MIDAMTTATHNPTVDARIDELRQVIEAYNLVTENLRASHEALTAEVQRLQDELASANAALGRSRRLAALGEMAAGIAHEVRNPLASIGLYARMLIEDLGDRPPQRDLADRIADAVRGLDAVVRDVLTYARQMPIHAGPVGVEAMFERAVDAVRPMIEQFRVEVAVEVDDSLATLAVDADLMHQALVNLVRNAAEAMGEVRGERRLTLSAWRDGGAAMVGVADTGPGIGDEAIDRIFNPFFTTRHTGTGLGLSIVHRIVDAHGGSIAVHHASRDDGSRGGAVFTLTLPCEPNGARPHGGVSADLVESPVPDTCFAEGV